MTAPTNSVWNLPNQLSAGRIVLAIGCFIALSWQAYGLALGLFALAAFTDWLDGYLARRLNLITQLGRILDPFADKVIVCGVFIYLAAITKASESSVTVAPWMAVVVTARELLVTALRSFVEQSGGDFSAKWAGKWKMVLQCGAIVGILGLLAAGGGPAAVELLVRVVLWAAIVLTIYSGWGYVRSAAAMMGK